MTTPRLTLPEFAAKLKQERKRLGLSQVAAARLCGVSLRSWTKWEAGTGTPIVPTVVGAVVMLRDATARKEVL
jgi:predicted transcriptional regulator